MIVVLAFEPAQEDEFTEQLATAMRTLAARPGFVDARAGRSVDDPQAWVLVLHWDSVGSYRRALGNYDVKLHATPLLAQALDRPSAFEQLYAIGTGTQLMQAGSDRSTDADARRQRETAGGGEEAGGGSEWT